MGFNNFLVGLHLLIPAIVLSTGIIHLKNQLAARGNASRQAAKKAFVTIAALLVGIGIATLLLSVDWVGFFSRSGQGYVAYWNLGGN